MVRWILYDQMARCPKGWQNFIEDLQTRLPFDSREGFSIKTINSELSPFCAVYNDTSHLISTLDFADERRYNLFVIKYGGQCA